MATKGTWTDEKTVRYLLSVIKSCADFQPDFNQVAREFELTTSRPGVDAQRRFKSIVEKAGFKLENGKQVTGGAPPAQDTTPTASKTTTTDGGGVPQTPKKPRKKVEPGSTAKRRKCNKGSPVKPEADEEDYDAAGGQHSKLEGQNAKDANEETA